MWLSSRCEAVKAVQPPSRDSPSSSFFVAYYVYSLLNLTMAKPFVDGVGDDLKEAYEDVRSDGSETNW